MPCRAQPAPRPAVERLPSHCRLPVPAFLALALLALPWVPAARADVCVDVHEESWSMKPGSIVLETTVRTCVKGKLRRTENQIRGGVVDSLARASRFVQIDRLDRDTSYFYRPTQGKYIPVALSAQRGNNAAGAARFVEAQRKGTAPRDTIPAVQVRDLGRNRKILGYDCRGVSVRLEFSYPDTSGGRTTILAGTLADTLWLAPLSSPPGDATRYDRDFAVATGAREYLEAATAIQLAQAHGQGLVAVVRRAVNRLDGFPMEMTFLNTVRGLPANMQGVHPEPDGSVVVQRTHRVAVAVKTEPLAPSLFELPASAALVEPLGGPGGGGQAP